MKNIKKPLQQFTRDDVKILKKEILHEGFCRIERYTLQNKMFDGTWTEPYTREFMAKSKAAVALPYDPVLDKVVLIEQFRVGALFQEKSPWLLELVAGIMDKENESFEDLIRRELLEEAGLEALELTPICDYLTSPGGTSENVRVFYAKVDATRAPKYCGLKEENEDIKIHVISSKEAFDLMHKGIIHNAAAIIALQWLYINLNLKKSQNNIN
jgi:ADP-ribose pyrophosphatase